MEASCPFCGALLPKDDARFCSKCGEPLIPRPHSTLVSEPGGEQPVSSTKPQAKSVLREQVAHQSVGALGQVRGEEPAEKATPPSQMRPETKKDEKPEPAKRKLRVTAWDQNEEDDQAPPSSKKEAATSLTIEQEQTRALIEPEQAAKGADEPIEDRPTSLLEASAVAEVVGQKEEQRSSSSSEPASLVPTEDRPTMIIKKSEGVVSEDGQRKANPPTPLPPVQAQTDGIQNDRDVEQVDTVHLPQIESHRSTVASSQQGPVLGREGVSRPQPVSASPISQGGPHQASVPIQPSPSPQSASPSQPGNVGYQQRAGTTSPAGASSSPSRRPGPSPRTLIISVAIVIVAIMGSLVVFSLFQHGVDDPWKKYTDTNLHFSVRYPIDWQVKTDKAKAQVQFYDANQTAQFAVTVAESDGKTEAEQFARKQAEKVGMTDIKDLKSLSFGNTTWEGVQGNMTVEGVTYQVQYFVTMQGKQVYLLTQKAIKATYDEDEHSFFEPMRQSWQFSS